MNYLLASDKESGRSRLIVQPCLRFENGRGPGGHLTSHQRAWSSGAIPTTCSTNPNPIPLPLPLPAIPAENSSSMMVVSRNIHPTPNMPMPMTPTDHSKRFTPWSNASHLFHNPNLEFPSGGGVGGGGVAPQIHYAGPYSNPGLFPNPVPPNVYASPSTTHSVAAFPQDPSTCFYSRRTGDEHQLQPYMNNLPQHHHNHHMNNLGPYLGYSAHNLSPGLVSNLAPSPDMNCSLPNDHHLHMQPYAHNNFTNVFNKVNVPASAACEDLEVTQPLKPFSAAGVTGTVSDVGNVSKRPRTECYPLLEMMKASQEELDLSKNEESSLCGSASSSAAKEKADHEDLDLSLHL